MTLVARALVLVFLVTCLFPHLHSSQPSVFFPAQSQQNTRPNTAQRQTARRDRPPPPASFPNTAAAPLPSSRPAPLPSSRPAPLPMLFPFGRPASPSTFPAFSPPRIPPSNLPFQQVLSSGLDSPSPIDYLKRDNFATSNDNDENRNGRRSRGRLPFPARSHADEGQPRGTASRRQAFSPIITLNPASTSRGVRVSGPGEDPLQRGRGPLTSLFDTDMARRYSLDAPSTFDRPISRTSRLPDINSPIRMDLASEELQRVVFAANKGKLPPSRGLNAIADTERPKLTSLLNTRPPTSLPRLPTPPPLHPSPSASPSPSSSPQALPPQKPGEKSDSKAVSSGSNQENLTGRKQAPTEDETASVEKERRMPSIEDPQESTSLARVGDTSVDVEVDKSTQLREVSIVSTTQQPPADKLPPVHTLEEPVSNDEGSLKREHSHPDEHDDATNITLRQNVESIISTTEQPGENMISTTEQLGENIISTTEQSGENEPSSVRTFKQPIFYDENPLEIDSSDLGDAAVVEEGREKPASNREMLSSAAAQPGTEDLPPGDEIHQPGQGAERSETDHPPPVDGLPQFTPDDERLSPPKSLDDDDDDDDDVPAINDFVPDTVLHGLGALSSSENHQDSDFSTGSVINHNGIALSFGDLGSVPRSETDREQPVAPSTNSKRTEINSTGEDEPSSNIKEQVSPTSIKDFHAEKKSTGKRIQQVGKNDSDPSFLIVSRSESRNAEQVQNTTNHHADSAHTSMSETKSRYEDTSAPSRISFSSADSLVALTHVPGVSDASPDSSLHANKPPEGDTQDRRYPNPLQESQQNLTEDAQQPEDVTQFSDPRDVGKSDQTSSSSSSTEAVDTSLSDSNTESLHGDSSGKPAEGGREDRSGHHVSSGSTPRRQQDNIVNDELTFSTITDDLPTTTPDSLFESTDYPTVSSSFDSSDSDQVKPSSTISEGSTAVATQDFFDSTTLSSSSGDQNVGVSVPSSSIRNGSSSNSSNRGSSKNSRSSGSNENSGSSKNRVPQKRGQEVESENEHTGGKQRPYVVGNEADPDGEEADEAGDEAGNEAGDEAGIEEHGSAGDASGPYSLQMDADHADAYNKTGREGDKPGARASSSSSTELDNPQQLAESLREDSHPATDKASNGGEEKSSAISDEYNQHISEKPPDLPSEPQQTLTGSQKPLNTKPQQSGAAVSTHNPSLTETGKSPTSPRAPASPFEMMFGKSLQDAYQQSFGSLFSNLRRPPSQSRALFGRGGLSVSAGVFGQGAESQRGRSAARVSGGSGGDDDKSLFDVSSIVKRRPSLKFFANS